MPLGERKTLFALVMLSILPAAACAPTTATVGTNTAVCAVWKSISWSSKDTDQTIGEVKVNNARRDGWCKDVR